MSAIVIIRDSLAIISTKIDLSAEEIVRSFACSEDIKDLSLLEALQRLLTLVFDKIRSSGELAEDIIITMIDAIMGAAIKFIQT